MILAVNCIHNLHLTLVMFLHYLTYTKPKHSFDQLKQRLINTWDRIPQGIIDEASGKHGSMHVYRQRDVTSNTYCDLATQPAQSHFRHTKTGSLQSHSHC